MRFSDKLRYLRKKKNVTQGDVAAAVGVSRRMILEYEKNGRYPRQREIYVKLAEFFDVELNYLLTEDEEFTADAEEKYGRRGARQAAALIEQVKGLFAGGEMADEDKDVMMKAIQEAYWESKEINKKYIPKKFLDEQSK